MEEQTKQPESLSLVDRAEAAAKAMKEENDRKENLLKQEQENRAKAMLGGTTDAGQTPEKIREETPKEYKDRIERESKLGRK